ncbi:MAG: immunoglobulin domain-containing protein [Akkermansiaceae bacterium]|nr:immunoglobulin domain-containing protein [Verrucomicrobiales bacterium]
MSSKTPGVIWTHNDDSDDPFLFAVHTNGSLLARFYHFSSLNDVEDMALGPGPSNGVSYLYLGDIGGKFSANEVRSSVRVLRIPEPTVSLSWASNPHLFDSFANVQSFTLTYPDGSFDAETLMLDPVTADLFVGTKQNNSTRIYRVNLNSATNNQTLLMTHVATVSFDDASGGAISANGGRIILRNEDEARMWIRCEGETVAQALARGSFAIPVIGRPTELNGEAIAFLPDGTGYITISDSTIQPPIYLFPALCSLTAIGTEITQNPQSVQVGAGTDVQFTAQASGTNLTYQWRFNNADIPGANSPTLLLTNVQPSQTGAYTLFVSGDGGTALSSAATLGVTILPPIIVAQPPPISLAAMGRTAQLTVHVQGTPPFTFSWTLNKRPIIATGPTLTLPNLQKANAGKYRVVVSNSAGQAVSGETQLKVLIAPALFINPLSQTTSVGGKVSLKAKAKGSPKIAYQWYFNNAPLAGAIKPQLVFKGVQPAQAGNYFVVVSNAVGIVTSSTAGVVIQ